MSNTVTFNNKYNADVLLVGWINHNIELNVKIDAGQSHNVENPDQYTKIEMITPQMLSSAPGLKVKTKNIQNFEQDSDLKYVVNFNFNEDSVIQKSEFKSLSAAAATTGGGGEVDVGDDDVP